MSKKSKGLFEEVPGVADEDPASLKAIARDDQAREQRRREKRQKQQRQKREKQKRLQKASPLVEKKPPLFPRVLRVAGVDPGLRNIGICVLEYCRHEDGRASITPLFVETVSLETATLGDGDMVRATRSLLDTRPYLLEVDALFIEEQPHRIGMHQSGNLKVILLASVLLGLWMERWEHRWQGVVRRDASAQQWVSPILHSLHACMQSGRVKNNYQPPGWTPEGVLVLKERAERMVLEKVPPSRLRKSNGAYTPAVKHSINKKFIYLVCARLFGRTLTRFLKSVGLAKADDFCDAIVHALAGCHGLVEQGLEVPLPEEPPAEEEREEKAPSKQHPFSSSLWASVMRRVRKGRSSQSQVFSRWEPGEQARLWIPVEGAPSQ